MTPKERKDMRIVLAAFLKVARHARNFPHPEIPVGRLRSEAVEAERVMERTLGRKETDLINERAFKTE